MRKGKKREGKRGMEEGERRGSKEENERRWEGEGGEEVKK